MIVSNYSRLRESAAAGSLLNSLEQIFSLEAKMKEHIFQDGVELKQCSKCKQWLSLENFTKHKRYKDGLSCWCKQCHIEYNRQHKEKKIEYNKRYRNKYKKLLQKQIEDYVKTPNGLVVSIFTGERQKSKRRKMPAPEYTLEELREWVFSQKKFWRLYDEWVKSQYNKWKKPSIDRINCKKGYTFDNIHLLTWEENKFKSKIDKKFKAKKIYQIKDGKIINEFPSVSFASKKLGIDKTHIWDCCVNKRKSCGGYQWKYSR
jgi:hypothetical protein